MRRVFAVAVVGVLGLAGCTDYGLDAREYTDTFWQGSDEDLTLDFLWVLDNSGTMSEEQDRLTESLTGIMAVFGETIADYAMGVITTDVDAEDQRGKLQGSPPVLGPATPDLAAAFLANAAVGTGGAKDEQGLAALQLAMTEAVDGGHNEGFFRDGAALDVIVISDEDDHTAGEVSDLMSDLMLVVPDNQRFRVHAVVGDEPSGCLSADTAADAGTRYRDAAGRTAGFVGSICAEDWTPLLESIGRLALGLQTAFELTKEPDPSTIVAYVDGDEVAPDETDGWTYDPGLNAVVFHGAAIPAPGAKVTVVYQIAL